MTEEENARRVFESHVGATAGAINPDKADKEPHGSTAPNVRSGKGACNTGNRPLTTRRVPSSHHGHTCARCGKHVTADHAVFSSFTRNHYCADVDACTRRVQRSHRNTTGPAALVLEERGGRARKDRF